MSEFCYTSACGHGEVKKEFQSEFTIDICQSLRKAIAGAGGSGALETSPCPYVVMSNLKPEETDTIDEALWKIQMCSKLGIIGFSSFEDLD